MGLENDIQSSILEYLQLLENRGTLYYIRTNSFSGTVIRSNGSKGYVKNNKPGCPDITVCYKGLFIGIEVKGKSKQSDDQKRAEEIIHGALGMYVLVHSLEEVIELLQNL